MHQDPVFRENDLQHTLDFASARGFGTLLINGDPSPIAAHIPFVLSADNTYIEAHVMRSNPIARALKQPQSALLTVSGPDGYISPDWYGVENLVPTWNYVAVHLRGTLTLMDQDKILGVLDRISAHNENQLLPKKPWTTDKMSADVIERLMRMIVPIRLDIDAADSTWKLGQNKPDAARNGAIEGLQTSPLGMEIPALAKLMKSGLK